ncbi:YfbK domain-containing protein [Halomonas sp. V046]|uniref:YfbK domain-containing protein n=1 Tax=Halomonas sp. V046 TaxID=3459611 RepID=UPI004043DF63
MSDELDRLKAELAAQARKPDDDVRARHLRAAAQAFDRHRATSQESDAERRPTPDRPRWTWIQTGVNAMSSRVKKLPMFAAGAVVAGLGVALIVAPQWDSSRLPAPHLPAPEAPSPAEPEALVSSAETEALVSSAASDVEAPSPSEGALSSSEGAALVDAIPAEVQSRLIVSGKVVTGASDKADAYSLTSRSVTVEPAPQPARESAAPPRARQVAPASPQVDVSPRRLTADPDSEAFPDVDESGVILTAEEPVSTFSVDVDTASYAIVRSSLLAGHLPPREAVRVEEMINYFPYDYPAPEAGEAPFRPTINTLVAPWDEQKRLVHIAIQGALPAVDECPPLNLVLLIDTSGSMQAPNKLPLLKQSIRLMLGELRDDDEVAIVAYAGSAGQVLAPTPASQRGTILAALDALQAGGGTAGEAGLAQAYRIAGEMGNDGEVSRVLLATDGDFNVGISDPDELKDTIARERASGVYLSVLGFGRGNLDDATMQALAQNGNGQAAYIDTLAEAQKVLVDQLAGALMPIANDVKIQVEFNPATVQEYRLIGYETRALRREDFRNDKVDAGDIGAGHQVTAIYEITPVGGESALVAPSRYGPSRSAEPTTPDPQAAGDDGRLASHGNEFGYLKLRYKLPGESTSRLIEAPILATSVASAPVPRGEAPARESGDAEFAVAIAGFGQWLSGATYLSDWDLDDAIALAKASQGDDAFGYRAEAIRLMRLAAGLSP